MWFDNMRPQEHFETRKLCFRSPSGA